METYTNIYKYETEETSYMASVFPTHIAAAIDADDDNRYIHTLFDNGKVIVRLNLRNPECDDIEAKARAYSEYMDAKIDDMKEIRNA